MALDAARSTVHQLLVVDRAVLKDIITRFDGKLALDAEVLRTAVVS